MALLATAKVGDKCVDEFGNVCVYNGLQWICTQTIATPTTGTFDFEVQDLIVITSGQTSFGLSISIANPYQTQMFINGLKAKYAVEYSFNGTGSVLNWVSTDYTLDTIDVIELLY
jgi:hypothetical protein